MTLDPREHLRLVRWATNRVARRFLRVQPRDREDLDQELVLELYRACGRFDPALGRKPSSYLCKCLYLKGLATLGLLIRRRSDRRAVRDGGPETYLFSELGRDWVAGSHGAFGRDDPSLEAVDEADGWVGAAVAAGRLLGRLDARLRGVVERRWGLGGRKAETLQEIADDLGVSRERVRQLEARAMRLLRGLAGAA